MKNATYFHHFHTLQSSTSQLQLYCNKGMQSQLNLKCILAYSSNSVTVYFKDICSESIEARQQFQQQVEENQVFGFCFLHNIRIKNTASYSGRQSESFYYKIEILARQKHHGRVLD